MSTDLGETNKKDYFYIRFSECLFYLCRNFINLGESFNLSFLKALRFQRFMTSLIIIIILFLVHT